MLYKSMDTAVNEEKVYLCREKQDDLSSACRRRNVLRLYKLTIRGHALARPSKQK